MKKYSEPKISLLVYVEEDILTESVPGQRNAEQVPVSETTGDTSVTLKMSDVISLGQ